MNQNDASGCRAQKAFLTEAARRYPDASVPVWVLDIDLMKAAVEAAKREP